MWSRISIIRISFRFNKSIQSTGFLKKTFQFNNHGKTITLEQIF
jgi:hypothetical protein